MTWTATAPFLATLILAAVAALFVYRHGGGTALEQLERANSVLAHRVEALERENTALHAEVAQLSAKTDITEAVAPVLLALNLHHVEAQRVFSRILTLLDLIAGRLGPEPGQA